MHISIKKRTPSSKLILLQVVHATTAKQKDPDGKFMARDQIIDKFVIFVSIPYRTISKQVPI